MASNIEKLIEDMENYIDTQSKPAAFSSSKIVINRDELEQYLQELKETTPDEIRRYQKMLANKEAILADARNKADQIIAQAQIKTDELVSVHQIMQQAYAQANQVVMIATKDAEDILNKANSDANDIRMGAIQYTDDLLNSIQAILGNSVDIAKQRNEAFINKMQTILDQVVSNREALRPEQVIQEPDAEPAPEASDSQPAANATGEAANSKNTSSDGDEQIALDVPEEFFRKD